MCCSRHGVGARLQSLVLHATLAEQHTRMQGFTARVHGPATPARRWRCPTRRRSKRAEPYTKIVEELPQMRREAVQLVRQAVGAGRRAYVLVNNRAEGNAPLTVEALVGMLRG